MLQVRSLPPDPIHGRITQLVEYLAHNQGVGGSIPPPATNGPVAQLGLTGVPHG